MPPEILIIRLSALGDVVTTLPLASAIKRHMPDAKVTWLVEKASAPLVFNNPAIDRVIIFPGKTLLPGAMASPQVVNSLTRGHQFWQEFKSHKYDIAIDAQGLFKSAFLSLLSGAKTRIGFAHTREFADKFLTHSVDVGNIFAPDRHIIDLYKILALKLFELTNNRLVDIKADWPFPEFALPTVPIDVEQIVQSWTNSPVNAQEKKFTDNYGAPIAVLIPGTTWTTKIWPAIKWQQLGNLLMERNGYKIILCGGPSEIATNQNIEESLRNNTSNGNILNLTGKTSLLELVSLFKNVQLVIGGDTGPLHLASAVGKANIVGIFGSTPWKRNGPYGRQAHSIALDLDFQPCFSKTCHLNTVACLNDLEAEYVYKEIMVFLLENPTINRF